MSELSERLIVVAEREIVSQWHTRTPTMLWRSAAKNAVVAALRELAKDHVHGGVHTFCRTDNDLTALADELEGLGQ